jgi:uncharacterized DUF497 family protein
MLIPYIIWLREVEEKLAWKHSLTCTEVEEALGSAKRFQFAELGDVDGEDLYTAKGRTDAGRYVIVFFIRKSEDEILIVSARDMTKQERRAYAKK